jgi:prepilin-type N-terminal cleavage/methylation domain-containing protein
MTANKKKAFTLVETLFVIGIFSILVMLTLPLSLDFYKKYQLNVYTEELIQALRRVQQKSMSIEQDSKFGIYLTEKSYVLFRGNSYAARETQYDETFDLPQAIKSSGLSEIVFTKSEGLPSATGSIVLSNNIENKIIDINSLGRINLE